MTATAAVQMDIEDVDGEAQQFLTFELSDETYGISIVNIKEIIEFGDLTIVPMMPDFIAGVINLRGSVVPVVELARRFQITPKEISKKTSIVIMEIHEDGQPLEIGIMVDAVSEVLELKPEQIATAPTFGTNIRADFISGMGKIDDSFMILLDIDHVLSIDELSALQNVGSLTGEEAAGSGEGN